MKKIEMNDSQKEALNTLKVGGNVFLTGAAGTGKSTVLRVFASGVSTERYPLLASTGAAAVLIGGRTFHSFFGLGKMGESVAQIVRKATGNRRICTRIENADGVIIDEVSMLPGRALAVAEQIARAIRGNARPWGGLRVIAVGDFGQLPPICKHGESRDWAFRHPVWEKTGFRVAALTEVVRSSDRHFLEVLAKVRAGVVDEEVTAFLNSRPNASESFTGTRLFGKCAPAEQHNLNRLTKLEGEAITLPTRYEGDARAVDVLREKCPVPELLHIKVGALVMTRVNDERAGYVNGSVGHVLEVDQKQNAVRVRLRCGADVVVGLRTFTLLDADGKMTASAVNFPLTLAWAMTIHKAQGMSLDQVSVDLKDLWDSGQAYVALSRATSPDGLYLQGWSINSVLVDPEVKEFHKAMLAK